MQIQPILVLLLVPMICLIVVGADAQTPDPADYEAVLLPVNVPRVEGAHGSVWTSVLSMINGGSTTAKYYPEGVTCQTLCLAPTVGELLPGRTGRPRTNVGAPQSGPSALLYLHKDTADQVGLSLRTQDLSRQSETYGTEIPVVRESEFHSDQILLITAPPIDGFRQTLRVYEMDQPPAAQFIVRVLNQVGDVLAEVPIQTVWNDPTGTPAGFPRQPGYAEIPVLESILPADELMGQSASIVIEPITPGVRFWAFISVTHNETQHVTVLTPQ